jgi:hypothetical protein
MVVSLKGMDWRCSRQRVDAISGDFYSIRRSCNVTGDSATSVLVGGGEPP